MRAERGSFLGDTVELFFTDCLFIVSGRPRPGVPFVVDQSMKLVEPVNDWLFRVAVVNGRTSRRPSTSKAYGYRITDFLNWAESLGLDWKRVTNVHLAAYRDWSLERCSVRTVNAHLSAIGLFYRDTYKRGLIDVNPYDSAELAAIDDDTRSRGRPKRSDLTLPVPNESRVTFDPEELRQLLRAAASWEEQLQMAMWTITGMRRAELAWIDDLAMQRMFRLLRRQREQTYPLRLTRTKNGDPRVVHLTAELAKNLYHWSMLVRPHRAELFQKRHGRPPTAFWISSRGNEVNLSWLSERTRRTGQRVGIKANPHKFRHTVGTETYAATGSLRITQKLLGHRSLDSTVLYEHNAPTDSKGYLEAYQQQIDAVLLEESAGG